MNCTQEECFKRHTYQTENKKECINCLLKSDNPEFKGYKDGFKTYVNPFRFYS